MTALNYNADATIDDGSCDYGCAEGQLEIVLVANDEYGDGWNGNSANVYFDGVLFDPAWG